ncbi:MAG: PAS domain-containing protein [bacterium]|nr:PAS domain-containing protein [bacterium]
MTKITIAPGVRLKVFAAVTVIATAGGVTVYWAVIMFERASSVLWLPASFLIFLVAVASLSEAVARLMQHGVNPKAVDIESGESATASERQGMTGVEGDLVEASRDRLDGIRRIGVSVNSTLNLEDVLFDILHGTLDALSASVGMVFLRDSDTGQLRMCASAGLSQEFVANYQNLLIAPGEGLTGRVAESGVPIVVECDVSHDPRVKVVAGIKEDLNSYLGMPIVVKGDCVAVINILTRPPDRLTENDVTLALAVGEYLGAAIRNTRVVDELTRATDEAKQTWDYLRSITDSIEDGIVVIEPDRTISYANSAYARQAGMDSREVVGQPCYTISHGESAPCRPPEHQCPLEVVLAEGRPHVTVHRHVGHDGAKRWVEVGCSPMLGPDGSVARGVEVTRDITDRKQMQESLIRSEQLAALGKMAATIAHEVRNPLASMKGALSVLRSQPERSADFEGVVDEIIGQVDRLSETIRVLLSFALPTLPGRELCDLNQVVERTLRYVKRKIAEKCIDVRVDLEPQDRVVALDLRLTAQALSNIVTNAIEAVEPGGTVLISSTFSHNTATLTVTDSGPGIQPQDLESIFQPLFSTKVNGIGLGLFTARHIVEQQRGTVSAENTPGQGARFRVLLPLEPSVLS